MARTLQQEAPMNKPKLNGNISLGNILTILALAAAIVASFVRVQTHAESRNIHRTQEWLDNQYVPRREIQVELDHLKGDLSFIREWVEQEKVRRRVE